MADEASGWLTWLLKKMKLAFQREDSYGQPIAGQFWELKGIGMVEIRQTGKLDGWKRAAVLYEEPDGTKRACAFQHFVDNAKLIDPPGSTL